MKKDMQAQGPKQVTLETAIQHETPTRVYTEGVNGIEMRPKEISLKATLNPNNMSEVATDYLKNKGAIRSGRIDMYDIRRKNGPKYTEEERIDLLERIRERDEQMVTGTFINYEDRSSGLRGGKCKLVYRKYSGEPEFYQLEDNVRYTIPYGLAHHLQFGCYNYAYNYLSDEMYKEVQQAFNPEGKMIFGDPHVKEPVQRFGFIPMDFTYHVEDKMPSDAPSHLFRMGY